MAQYESRPSFHTAARDGDLLAVHRLLAQGTLVDSRDGHGMTALHHAAEMGHVDVALSLIRKSADIDAQSKFDGDPHEGKDGELGRTALHYAVAGGHIGVVDLLLRHGADSNAQDRYKLLTPLQIAVTRSDLATAKVLLLHGCNLNVKDRHGWTALCHANAVGNRQMVALLNEHATRD